MERKHEDLYEALLKYRPAEDYSFLQLTPWPQEDQETQTPFLRLIEEWK